MINNISMILVIVSILTVFVNIITEVVKSAFEMKNTKHINLFVTIISVVLTTLVLLAYCQIKAVVITWHIVIACVIVGFMVAYAAMFGYDKLLSYFKDINK